MSDASVRVQLCAPSIDCIFRTRRLLYAARLARNGPTSLKALLDSKVKENTMPWMRLLHADLAALYEFLSHKFETLTHPSSHSQPWLDLMIHCPLGWKSLVKLFVHNHSCFDRDPTLSVIPFAPQPHLCTLCIPRHVAFPTAKALAQHMRIVHGEFIDASGVCPVCGTNLHTRLRVIAHLSDPRRNIKGRQALCSGLFPRLPLSTLSVLDVIDMKERRQARKAGRTHVVAVQPAHRANGRICGRPAMQ